mmetsp:Transcript_3176/g.8294  ORF Transcript_3176/g.8294 Transcript_3176/m.8294 type:complete len:222 (-) Transcript_3176:312-977(-)
MRPAVCTSMALSRLASSRQSRCRRLRRSSQACRASGRVATHTTVARLAATCGARLDAILVRSALTVISALGAAACLPRVRRCTPRTAQRRWSRVLSSPSLGTSCPHSSSLTRASQRILYLAPQQLRLIVISELGAAACLPRVRPCAPRTVQQRWSRVLSSTSRGTACPQLECDKSVHCIWLRSNYGLARSRRSLFSAGKRAWRPVIAMTRPTEVARDRLNI